MSNPAVGAKYVTALVVGVVGAGAFAGVSHDGRGGAPPDDTETFVEVLSPTTTIGSTTVGTVGTASASTTQIASTLAAQPAEPAKATQPAEAAPPDPVPTRARVRSRGS